MSNTSRPISNVILFNENGDTVGDSTTPLVVSSPSPNTYSAAIGGLVAAASATDIFTITGSASKIVYITRIALMGTQTTASSRDIYLIKRSSANTNGTSSTLTNVPLDSNNAAATAVVRAYTANPSGLGTAVGNIRTRKVFVSLASGNTSNADEMILEFGTRNTQPLVLRGTSELVAINLNGVTIAGNSFCISVEWTEV